MAKSFLLWIIISCLTSRGLSQGFDDTLEDYDERVEVGNSELSHEERTQLKTLLIGDTFSLRASSLLQGDVLKAGLLAAEEESLCPNHTELFIQALASNAPWAVQMIDATGRQPSGLLRDNNLKWLGSWEECLAAEPIAYEEPVNKTGAYKPFEPKYCDTRLTMKQTNFSRALTVTVGMCFPSTCSPKEDKNLAKQYLTLLQLDRAFTVKSVTCKETDLDLTDKAIFAIVVCSIILTAMVLATVYDLLIVFYLNKPKTTKEGISNPVYDSMDMAGGKTDEKTPLLAGNSQTHQKPVLEVREYQEEQYKPGKLGQALLSFSVYTNALKILDTKQPPGSITAINGIRFLSMSWVILGHTLGSTGMDNYRTWISEMIKRWPFMAIANATPSVDTFFLLSGMLVAYLALKDMKKRGGPRKVNWLLYYFHRYWRLTPPYMLVLMVYVTCMKYWGDGPIWSPTGMQKDECADTWWHNLLYINNLIKVKSKCMGWSWYLANDMQFFWLSPLMIIPLYYSKVLGGIVCMAFILANLIATGVISRDNEFYATQKLDTLGVPSDRSNMIYIKPYTRIGPYVVGVLYGYLLYVTKCKVRIPKVLNVLCWIIAITIGVLVIYGPYTSDGLTNMNLDEEAFYNSAHRIAWGVAVGWVVFACATGYGGPINTLLSWPGIIPLSRLTYCAYLVHLVILRIYNTTARSLRHWYDLQLVYIFIGHMWTSMAVAFVVSLAFESPMMGLEKVLLAKYKK